MKIVLVLALTILSSCSSLNEVKGPIKPLGYSPNNIGQPPIEYVIKNYNYPSTF
jgi:uncharacterized lipoprotein